MATSDATLNSSPLYYPDEQFIRNQDNQTDEKYFRTKIAVVVMLSVFSVVGVIGNAIAFYIFFARRATSTSIIFILALAGTDFLTCLVTIPYTIVFELRKYDLVYDFACKTYMFLITSTVPFSAYIMVGIALDRYFCICHPFLYVFTLPRAKAVIFCMSIPAVVFGVITALSHGTYIYDPYFQQYPHARGDSYNITSDEVDKAPAVDLLSTMPNATNMRLRIIPYHECVNNTFIFSKEFLEEYKKVHALNFLLAYVSVAVLYSLIYKSIFTRRVNKAKRKKYNLYPKSSGKMKENPKEETQMTIVNGRDGYSPKTMNNQTKKDAKCPRKITLTARNDPSALRQPPFHKTTSGSICANENRNVVMPDSVDAVEEIRVTEECVSKEDDNGVYIGPHATLKTVSPEQAGDDVDDDCGVYLGPRPVVSLKCTFKNNTKDSREADAGDESKDQGCNISTNKDPTKVLERFSTADHCNSGGQEVNEEDFNTAGANPEEKPLLSQPPEGSEPCPSNMALCGNLSSPGADEKQWTTESGGKRNSLGKHPHVDVQPNSVKRKRQNTVRDRHLMANIKTALMLFTVTLVFIIAFLPALLMANDLIPLNLIAFYAYFIYNVVNPFIYAFMNQTFREDLKKLVNVCCR